MAQGNVNAAEQTKVYSTTQINDSSTISLPTGAAIEDVRCRAVKFSSGALVLAGAGDQPFGVGIITNNVNVAQGDFIDVQYKNIGLVYTGGSFGVGAALSVDANACFVAQTSGNAVAAVALEASGGAGVYVKALLVTGHGVEAAAVAATYALNDLTDVDTTGKADGKVLKYNGTTSKWVPGTDATE